MLKSSQGMQDAKMVSGTQSEECTYWFIFLKNLFLYSSS